MKGIDLFFRRSLDNYALKFLDLVQNTFIISMFFFNVMDFSLLQILRYFNGPFSY